MIGLRWFANARAQGNAERSLQRSHQEFSTLDDIENVFDVVGIKLYREPVEFVISNAIEHLAAVLTQR